MTTDATVRLFAADLVERKYAVSMKSARAMLRTLEAKHGPEAVGRTAGPFGSVRRYTTEAALERVGPAYSRRLSDILERLTVVEDENRALRRDIVSVTNRLNAFERRQL